MEITYTLTPQDVLHYQRCWAKRYRKSWLWLHLCALILCVAYVVWHIVVSSDKASAEFNGFFPLFIGLFVWYALERIVPVMQAKNMPEVVQPRTLRIMPEYLVGIYSNRETKTRWQGLLDVFEDGDCLFIMSSKQHGSILPRRVFITPALAQEFFDTVMACWNAAKAGEPPPVIASSGAWPPPPNVNIS